MATRAAYAVLGTESPSFSAKVRYVQKAVTEVRSGSSPSAGPSVYFYMRGRDVDCVTQPTYRYWAVLTAPDFTAAQYAGPKCGASPLAEVSCIRKR